MYNGIAQGLQNLNKMWTIDIGYGPSVNICLSHEGIFLLIKFPFQLACKFKHTITIYKTDLALK